MNMKLEVKNKSGNDKVDDVAKVAVETIHNLMHLVRELYPDDPETQEMLDIDAVMLQANVVVNNLTKEKTNV